MDNYNVIFVYHSMAMAETVRFTEAAKGNSITQVADAVGRQLEKRKFIEYPGGLIPVSCIGEIIIKKVDPNEVNR